MDKEIAEEHPIQILRRTHPNWTEEQIQEAKETLDLYLNDLLQIYERIRNDSQLYAEFKALIASRKRDTIKTPLDPAK